MTTNGTAIGGMVKKVGELPDAMIWTVGLTLMGSSAMLGGDETATRDAAN